MLFAEEEEQTARQSFATINHSAIPGLSCRLPKRRANGPPAQTKSLQSNPVRVRTRLLATSKKHTRRCEYAPTCAQERKKERRKREDITEQKAAGSPPCRLKWYYLKALQGRGYAPPAPPSDKTKRVGVGAGAGKGRCVAANCEQAGGRKR
jgi:hypothetical protein